jgi:hypothetical protein
MGKCTPSNMTNRAANTSSATKSPGKFDPFTLPSHPIKKKCLFAHFVNFISLTSCESLPGKKTDIHSVSIPGPERRRGIEEKRRNP